MPHAVSERVSAICLGLPEVTIDRGRHLGFSIRGRSGRSRPELQGSTERHGLHVRPQRRREGAGVELEAVVIPRGQVRPEHRAEAGDGSGDREADAGEGADVEPGGPEEGHEPGHRFGGRGVAGHGGAGDRLRGRHRIRGAQDHQRRPLALTGLRPLRHCGLPWGWAAARASAERRPTPRWPPRATPPPRPSTRPAAAAGGPSAVRSPPAAGPAR